jgi:hypothetical protein
MSAGFVLVFIFGFMAWQTPTKMTFPHGEQTHIDTYVGPVWSELGWGDPAAVVPSGIG